MNFSFIYPDNNGKYRRKEVGQVIVGQRGPDDLKSLNSLRFVIGDYIDLAIYQKKEKEEIKNEDRDRERRPDFRRGERRSGNGSVYKHENIGGASNKEDRERERRTDR